MRLEKLLQYKNSHLLKRYRNDYPDNQLSAEEALKELLKFLWLSDKRQQEVKRNPKNRSLQFACTVHTEMKEIDDMWHTFLLFTRDYMEFCFNYFGHYLHHEPNTKRRKPIDKKYKKALENYFSYIYDHLGEATLRKWFAATLKESR